MGIMILLRICAQIIDIFIYLAMVIISFVFILPILMSFFTEPYIPALLIFILTIILNFALQYPFLTINQTLGKGFFGLELVSTNESRPLDITIVLQREIFGKLISCYMICIPVLFGKLGGHEIGTETKVIKKIKKQK